MPSGGAPLERRLVDDPADRVGCACRDDPVVTGAERLAGGVERDDETVLEHHLRRRARRHGDGPSGGGEVEIDEHGAACILDLAGLVPAPHAQMASGCRSRREPQIDRQRGAGERHRASRLIDFDAAELSRPAVELAVIVGDLDPVVVAEAQDVVPAERGGPHPDATGEHLEHRGDDRAVVARPDEGGGARRAAVMHLDAIGLVLGPAEPAGRRQRARVVVVVDLDRPDGEPGARRRDGIAPSWDVGIRCGARHPGVDAVQPHLPDRLRASGGVDAHRGLDEIRGLDVGDLTLPDVEVGEVGAASRQRGGLRPVGLRVVGDVGGSAQLRQQRVELERLAAVVLGEDAVHVHAPAPDGEGPAAESHLEGVGRRPRNDRNARDPRLRPFAREVDRSRGQPPLQDLHQLVPVGVEQQATLLHDHAGVIAARVEPHPAQVSTHRFVPCPVVCVLVMSVASRRREPAGREAQP